MVYVSRIVGADGHSRLELAAPGLGSARVERAVFVDEGGADWATAAEEDGGPRLRAIVAARGGRRGA
eukprot:15418571-Alexandrium_andersonii.AAC.1